MSDFTITKKRLQQIIKEEIDYVSEELEDISEDTLEESLWGSIKSKFGGKDWDEENEKLDDSPSGELENDVHGKLSKLTNSLKQFLQTGRLDGNFQTLLSRPVRHPFGKGNLMSDLQESYEDKNAQQIARLKRKKEMRRKGNRMSSQGRVPISGIEKGVDKDLDGQSSLDPSKEFAGKNKGKTTQSQQLLYRIYDELMELQKELIPRQTRSASAITATGGQVGGPEHGRFGFGSQQNE